jgi:hypothetical protein
MDVDEVVLRAQIAFKDGLASSFARARQKSTLQSVF